MGSDPFCLRDIEIDAIAIVKCEQYISQTRSKLV